MCLPSPTCSNPTRLNMFPSNGQPHTYSQSSFIFCITEGSWFLWHDRRRLLIRSMSPPSFTAWEGDNSS